MQRPTIVFNDVSKVYGGTIALSHVSLEVYPGKIYGLLGPNGSGKSTLMKIILGIVVPEYGEVRVNGLDPKTSPMEVRKIVGYVPEEPAFYESLTPSEYFSFLGSVYGVDKETLAKRVNALVEAFEFEEYLHELIGALSHGNKQKVAIIAALLHDPEIFVLDEPLSGLDPKVAKIFKELLREKAREGKTVLFSTHVLEIAENLCDEVVILWKGSVVAQGSVEEIRDKLKATGLEEAFLRLTGSSQIQQIVEALKSAI